MYNNEYFLKAIKEVKNLGFKVFISANEKPSNLLYCFISDGKNVGYMQAGDYGGVTFSTVHKPNRLAGGGYGLQNWDEAIYNITVENVKESFIKVPFWASGSEAKTIVKYYDLQDFLNDSRAQNLIEY